MRRRVWLDWHRWLGLKLSILMSFILITGTLATVSHEIDWLIDSDLRVSPRPAEERASWGSLIDAVRAAYPDVVIDWISAPIDPWFAAEAVVLTPDGERRRIRIDPYTADVRGDASWGNAQRILRDAHRRLMIFHPIGIIFVSSFALLLLGSLVTGLVVYRRFWRGFFKNPRRRDARTLWGDLHRLGGVWSIWFIVVIGLTSVWYLVEATVARAPDLEPVMLGTASDRSALAVNATPLPFDDLVARAELALPDFTITQVRPPSTADAPARFNGQTDAILVRDGANEVQIDPYSGGVLAVLNATDLSPHQRISEMADPLHFGTFGGLATKILYLVFGIVLSGLGLSGIYIFSARIRRASQPPRSRHDPSPQAVEVAE